MSSTPTALGIDVQDARPRHGWQLRVSNGEQKLAIAVAPNDCLASIAHVYGTHRIFMSQALKHHTPISAVLITLNAERHLAQVLTALAGCDELVVLDSGSMDATRDIAVAHNANFSVRAFDGYGAQKRAAVALARNDWVLLIDADETLDATLSAALASVDLSDPHCAFRVHRRNFVGAQEIRHGIFGNEWVVRLFNRTTANISTDVVHEAVRGADHVHDLPGSMLHASFADGAELFARMAKYARAKASTCRVTGRRASAPLLLLRAAWAFFRCYILKGGFRDGRIGVLVALSTACDAVVGLAMASEDA